MITTPRMKLRSNEGTDAFSREDFVYNWGLLDAAPGTAIGLSTGRPSWDASQAGRMFLETDTGRLMYWTGSAWTEPQQLGQSFGNKVGAPTLPASITAGNASNVTIETITLPRPARLVGNMWLNYGVGQDDTGYFNLYAYIGPSGSTVDSTISVGNVRLYADSAGSGSRAGTLAIGFRTGLLAKGTYVVQGRIVSQATNPVNHATYSLLGYNAVSAL